MTMSIEFPYAKSLSRPNLDTICKISIDYITTIVIIVVVIIIIIIIIIIATTIVTIIVIIIIITD